MARIDDILVENAEVRYLNLSGRQTEYNDFGERNFELVIRDDEMAQKLINDGWNVKLVMPKNEFDRPFHKLKVSVRYDRIAPKIYMVADGVTTLLDEETVGQLDKARLEMVDLIINPSFWSKKGASGIKAYLREGYFTIKVSPLARKYHNQIPYSEED